MIPFSKDILNFFINNFPDVRTMLLGGLPALLWAVFCLSLAGHIKMHYRLPTGYTRKIFHFMIFGSVIVVHAIWGMPGVCLFGAMTSVVIGYALVRGPGHFMYEAMAREKDEPRRTYYIVIAYLATLIGGLISGIFFPRTAVFGYLVCGLGDAVAEPIGTRFGRHEYRALAIGGVHAVRSLEGSVSIFLVSLLTLIIFMFFSQEFPLAAYSVLVAIMIAVASAAIEAISPHGWDNATMQVVPAWLGQVLL